MKHLDLSVMNKDTGSVLEYLGRRGVMHFSDEQMKAEIPEASLNDNRNYYEYDDYDDDDDGESQRERTDFAGIAARLEKIRSSAAYIGVQLHDEPEEDSRLPGEAEDALTEKICGLIADLQNREKEARAEKEKVSEAFGEAKAFEYLNAPFSDLDQLSYLTLRVGRLDPHKTGALQEALSDRAVVIPLGEDGRILAAASRKGRFALDTELKKNDFVPIAIPEDYKGVPAEMLSGMEAHLASLDGDLAAVETEKQRLKKEYGQTLCSLSGSYIIANQVGELKKRLKGTRSVSVLSGWAPADQVPALASDLAALTAGRIGIRVYNPEEMPELGGDRSKVPVSLSHGRFVRSFESLVFSYGAPLYGTIDPTPFVAFFFTVLFGIMFGDLGQGLVLLALGLLSGKKGLKAFAGLRVYSSPLVAVGVSSMVMGLLTGEFFTSEQLLAGPTRAVTGLLTGRPVSQILHLMPDGGSITKLFYFFGFTLAVGAILNSIGLLVNIVNRCILRQYEQAFFAKTGVSGLLLFWWALGLAMRVILGGGVAWFDIIGFGLPILSIFFGPLIWRIIARERPLLENGFMGFVMEGFVEILETASNYVSNTVSFLRVGAFALSHAVLSFIVFTLSEMVRHLSAGPLVSLVILVIGNAVIILLEGMIVAIQVVRLQYYEFFSKFFTETGVPFEPFRFRKERG
jgi:V/A-type H+-transporting ATPase subunit I